MFQVPGGDPTSVFAQLAQQMPVLPSVPMQPMGQVDPGSVQAALVSALQKAPLVGSPPPGLPAAVPGPEAGPGPAPVVPGGTAGPPSPFGDSTIHRGNPGSPGAQFHRGRGFVWGGRQWGPNDFPSFLQYLAQFGVSISQWARAHPAAFASFNINPMVKDAVVNGPTPGPAVGSIRHQ